MKPHLIIALMVLGAALTAGASGIVRNVTIRQVKPWQGLVEVDYELTEDRSADTGLSTVVTFTDRATGKSYSAITFTHPFTYTKGKKRMIWNAAKDGAIFKSANVVCTVTIKKDPLSIAGLYQVVDLSGGPDAASYPVTTLSAVPAGGWTDEYKTTKLVLRYIAPGTFTMGCPADEPGYDEWCDVRQKQVTLTKGFYIGVFEVTQRQWELVMGTRPSRFRNTTYYATRPVENVSYDMIRGGFLGYQWPQGNAVDEDSFLGVLRAKTGGLLFDLPTEAQWEYACRAGTETAFNNGKNTNVMDVNERMNEVGRYAHNGGLRGTESSDVDAGAGTAKVGSYLSNAWGLYDMHGNVEEWCLDWVSWQFDDVTDPIGTIGPSDARVVRGGSCYSWAINCRSASSSSSSPDNCGLMGFRLACSVGVSK